MLGLKEKINDLLGEGIDGESDRGFNRKTDKKSKSISIILIGVIVLISMLVISFITSQEGKVTTIAETSLKEVLTISELATVEYTYNSIATVKENNTEKYYVSYKGTVQAGINFDDIKIEEKEKKIIIHIPDIKILKVNIDDELDYIFVKKKYDTEKTFQEAYTKCLEDLQEKANKNKQLRKMAEENAKTTIQALFKPFEEQIPQGYEIVWK